MGSDAGASVSNTNMRCSRVVAACDQHLVRVSPDQVLIRRCRALLAKGLTNSEVRSEPLFELTADTLNTCCSVQHEQHSVFVEVVLLRLIKLHTYYQYFTLVICILTYSVFHKVL